MTQDRQLRQGVTKIGLQAVLALFLIPAILFWFTGHVFEQWDQSFTTAVMRNVPAEKRVMAEMAITEAKPSAICWTSEPELAKHKADACAAYSQIWQFTGVRSLALGSLIGGVVLLVLAGLFSAAAFGSPRLQYASFATGKAVMIWASALTVIVQGIMLAWASFWLPAFFFHAYSVKIILVAVAAVAIAVIAAVFGIFSRQTSVNRQPGELVREADAPRLWARLKEMADRLKTAPPANIVAGIDTNFFVTEAPLQVGEHALKGRTLYVSLPLLRKLETVEADAVLAHELAHLSGGDTANSARLGPALQHYDEYCGAMRSSGVTFVIWPLLAFYRVMFEFALARSRREREFRADATAAGLVSAQAIAHSLIKVAAYAIYRNKIEGDLFGQRTQHTGTLGIAQEVERGLGDFVHSPAFMERIKTVHVPHPFDSHPPLADRMNAVGVEVAEADYPMIAAQVPATSWVNEITTAEGIEQRLWGVYDQAFAAQHEQSLALRYEPANEAERATVLKHFPNRVFNLKKDATVEVTYEGVRSSANGALIGWDAVKALNYKSGHFCDSLIVTLFEPRLVGNQSVTINLPGIGKQKDALNAALISHWRRHQIMRAYAKHQADEARGIAGAPASDAAPALQI